MGQVVGTAVTFPLDVAKTRMQTNRKDKKLTTTEALRVVYREDGFGGMLRMFPPKGLSQGITRFTYYYIYAWLLTFYKNRYGKPATLANLLIGYVAGLLNTGVLNPCETVSNMVIDVRTLSVNECMQRVIQRDGYSGFFRGWESTFVVSMNPAIQNTVYDQIKAFLLLGMAKSSGLGYWQSFWLGAFSKAVATVSTFPVQRAKMIVQCSRDGGTPQPMGDMLTEIMQEEGISGLFKGLKPALYKGVLQSAFMLMVKEQIQIVTRQAIRKMAGVE